MAIQLTDFVRLPGRGVLRVGGEAAEEFLQSLVSNNVAPAATDRCVYATLLTPQGKFLHDFFVWRDGQGFLLETEAPRLPDLQRRLKMYKLRARVDLNDESTDWLSIVTLSDERPQAPFAAPDPRSVGLGHRVLLSADTEITGSEAVFADWDARRIGLCIPDGSRDLEIEKSFLLEHHMDRLNAIDFKKGCYVGQELTARTKYRGNVRRKLAHVRVQGALPDHGTPVLVDGIQVGQVLSGLGTEALAMLRIERPEGALEAGASVLTVV